MSEEQKISADEKTESEKVNETISSEENKLLPVNEPSITIQLLKIWKYIINLICITERNHGKNIFLSA